VRLGAVEVELHGRGSLTPRWVFDRPWDWELLPIEDP